MELQEISHGVFVRKASAQAAVAEGGGSQAEPAAGPFRDQSDLEAACAEQWRGNPALRQEFSSLDAYTAFRKAEARGSVKIVGPSRGVVRGSQAQGETGGNLEHGSGASGNERRRSSDWRSPVTPVVDRRKG